VTPKTEAKRDEALNQGLSLTVDGRVYTVRAGDLTGMDAAALRREVGMSFMGLMKAMQSDPDVDLIAALMWLSRRIEGEKLLSYEEVAQEVGYDVDIDLADAEEPEDADPEG
jgi:hypothetical protein